MARVWLSLESALLKSIPLLLSLLTFHHYKPKFELELSLVRPGWLPCMTEVLNPPLNTNWKGFHVFFCGLNATTDLCLPDITHHNIFYTHLLFLVFFYLKFSYIFFFSWEQLVLSSFVDFLWKTMLWCKCIPTSPPSPTKDVRT